MKSPAIPAPLPALLLALGLALAFAGFARSQQAPSVSSDVAAAAEPYLIGRDVPWVPTPPVLIDKMFEMARLTPQDVVVDLGSGDGRTVIAAARRGARARGVEFNPDLAEQSRRLAAEAGVADRATFVQGNMFETDFSDATVLPLFLLTENLDQLVPKFLALRPGTRIVNNGFEFGSWEYDEIGHLSGKACGKWCIAYLYIVPARVAGRWQTNDGELTLEQDFQYLTGTLTSRGRTVPIVRGRVQGDVVRFNADGVRYTGRVDGDTIAGQRSGEYMLPWSARR